MLYHGVDLVEVARVRRAVERWGEHFLRRIFTPGELIACGWGTGATPRYESLAARWAAKEAAAKALGCGLSGLAAGPGTHVACHDLEVTSSPSGRPELRLHGEAALVAAALGLTHLALSLSHTQAHAIASVVGLAEGLDFRF